ncbi:GNAT family N-acetyltransferase [Halosimplex salinum]|uniref:GNAT family N-acetyltransferase n=1 Tax=Halosimplex salinum TaxID=1710538 RepID=UPI000F4ADC8D|nr:GNAT family protein [Halosimplex salinum]
MPGPVFLRGDGVTLHPVEESDVDFCTRLVNDPEVRHGLSIARPKRHDEEREFRVEADDDVVPFVVCAGDVADDPADGERLASPDDSDRVGVVDLVDVDEQFGNAEVGYFFAPEAWGNGYATAAVERVVEYAFAERRLHRVHARVFEFNEGSARVLEKVGFEREGVLREQAYMHGEYVDTIRYGLLESEW